MGQHTHQVDQYVAPIKDWMHLGMDIVRQVGLEVKCHQPLWGRYLVDLWLELGQECHLCTAVTQHLSPEGLYITEQREC